MSEETYTTRTEPQEPFSLEAMEKAIRHFREEFPETPDNSWHFDRWCLSDLTPDLQFDSIIAKWRLIGMRKGV